MAKICSCGIALFPNTNRPNCVIEMQAIAFVILVPRYKADGVTRNTIDVFDPAVGLNIKALLSTSLPTEERIYPFPRCENVTFEMTDPVYETTEGDSKYLIDNVGQVYTMKVQNWGKDAVNAILREYEKVGCTEIDMLLVDVAGAIWGIKENENDQFMRGYDVATETFVAFKEFAMNKTKGKIMTSWDFDQDECVSNSYAITAQELGYKATTLKGNGSAQTYSTPLTTTTTEVKVLQGFGTAGVRKPIVGLLDPNFVMTNIEVPAVPVNVPVTSVEIVDGEYVLTHAVLAATEAFRTDVIDAAGYDVTSDEFESL